LEPTDPLRIARRLANRAQLLAQLRVEILALVSQACEQPRAGEIGNRVHHFPRGLAARRGCGHRERTGSHREPKRNRHESGGPDSYERSQPRIGMTQDPDRDAEHDRHGPEIENEGPERLRYAERGLTDAMSESPGEVIAQIAM